MRDRVKVRINPAMIAAFLVSASFWISVLLAAVRVLRHE